MRVNDRLIFLCSLISATTLAACKGSENATPGQSGSVADTSNAAQSGATQGIALKHFTGNLQQAVAGRALFIRYNCYGCHGGLAGGAMGPSLRDTTWKYGGTDTAIFLTITQGRPLGMPHWGGVIPDSEVHLLISYIRSLRTDAEPKFFFAWPDTLRAANIAVSFPQPKS
jgi:mono/diheme cytochrome c family protein